MSQHQPTQLLFLGSDTVRHGGCVSVVTLLGKPKVFGIVAGQKGLVMLDISGGKESIRIPVFNTVDNEGPPADLQYIRCAMPVKIMPIFGWKCMQPKICTPVFSTVDNEGLHADLQYIRCATPDNIMPISGS